MADTPETPDDIDNMSMEEMQSFKDSIADQPLPEDGSSKPVPEQAPQPDSEDDEAALAAAEADQSEGNDKRSKTVPHKTFNYANERRKNAEQREKEANERYARLEERTKVLLEMQQKPTEQAQSQADEIPDPDTDPHGAIKWLKSQIDGRNKSEAEQKAAAEKQTAEQREFQERYDRVNTDYAAASASDPTIIEAHNALRESIGTELMEVYGYTQQQALQELVRIENEHVVNIANSGRPLGDYIKGLARARGWRPGAAQQQQSSQPPANNANVAEKARAAAASLGNSGGAVANTGQITPAMLADMSDEDFAAYMEKNKGTRKAFGVEA